MPDGSDLLPVPPLPAGLRLKNPAAPGQGIQAEELPMLFTPIKIREVELKNRIVVSPMWVLREGREGWKGIEHGAEHVHAASPLLCRCEYSAQDGFMNAYHLSHLSQYAIRGCGLIIFEASGVLPNGRITPWCPGIWKDEHIAPLKAINDLCHAYGAKTALQIAHAGRKASSLSPFFGKGHDVLAGEEHGGWPDNVWGPSAIKNSETQAVPHEMTKEQIEEVVKAFGDAARRCEAAGFDAIDIHGAHGETRQDKARALYRFSHLG